MQTKKKYYFLCERWLAVEKDDGQIERLLPHSTEVQKTELIRLVKKESKEKFKDGHLWLSIFIRPKQSTFTRFDRTICAFVLLYMSMVMNLAYYTVSDSPAEPGTSLIIGPVKITLQQISIGVLCNLIVLPPTMLLMVLFTKSKRRVTQLQGLKNKLNKNQGYIKNARRNGASKFGESNVLDEIATDQSQTEEKSKIKKSPKLLPWWCKIVAHVLSFLIILVCSFFMAIFGIQMGNEKVTEWLTSFCSSLFSSIFLTQPIKVLLLLLLGASRHLVCQ